MRTHRMTAFGFDFPRRYVLRWVIPLLAVFDPSICGAAAFPRTDAEFARLPPYCAARLKKAENPAAYKTWESRLGMNCFIHIHHYCAALNNVELAMRAVSKKDREQNLADSLAGGFDYMWNQAGASCSMMPEILVNKGKALTLMERRPEAAETFQKALGLNPRYVPAYAALADLYRQSGQTDAARQLLNHALKLDPKNRAITRRLDELNGRTGSPAKGER